MTCCWITPARFALVLAAEGCTVEAICPPAHVIRKLKEIGRTYSYNGFLHSIRAALLQSKPDFIIPCDDFGTSCLFRIHQQEQQTGDAHGLAAIIQRSLGNPESCNLITERGRFVETAKLLGIRVPETKLLPLSQTSEAWFHAQPYPAYVKADGTSGGVGVRRVASAAEAHRAAAELNRPPGALRTLKRFVVDQDRRLLQPFLERTHPALSFQELIDGSEANAAIACWQGELIGCICFEVVERTETFGPATVLRVIEHAQIQEAAKVLVAHLQLTGLYGLDFILSPTGDAYLLEMNARATQTCHLVLGPGRSPLPALAARMQGRQESPEEPLTEHEAIALFPAEWLRDPASPNLAQAFQTFQDVPWDSPKLIDATLQPNLLERLSPASRKRYRTIRASLAAKKRESA